MGWSFVMGSFFGSLGTWLIVWAAAAAYRAGQKNAKRKEES